MHIEISLGTDTDLYRHLLQKYHIGQILRITWKQLRPNIQPKLYLYYIHNIVEIWANKQTMDSFCLHLENATALGERMRVLHRHFCQFIELDTFSFFIFALRNIAVDEYLDDTRRNI